MDITTMRIVATLASLAVWCALVWFYLFDAADRGEFFRILKARSKSEIVEVDASI